MLETNKIYNMDAIEGLKELEEGSIQCIWTDPPYNIDYKYDKYKDKRIDYFEWCEEWLKECYRVLKKDGSLFVKMWSRYMFSFGNLLLKTNFQFKNVIIWKRKSCANYDDKYLGGYEIIFFFTKQEDNKFIADGFLRDTQFLKRWDGTKEYKGRLNDLWDDVKPVTAGNLIHPEGIYVEGTGKKEHPAQHPEEIVLRCLKCSTIEGDLVLDIFMGSGTVASVCKKINRSFIGFEISEHYCKIAEERLSQLNSEEAVSIPPNPEGIGYP